MPKGPRTYVISDIHGCASELKALIKKLPLEDDSKLVFLGDYIDRGPDSCSVIEQVIELSQKYETVTLMGNHEKMFLDFLEDKHSEDSSLFVVNGGSATLASYSENHEGFHIPKEHLTFIKNLKYLHSDENYIYVHAGLPEKHLNDLDNDHYYPEYLWARNKFFNSKFKWEKQIIHGHTPSVSCHFSKKRINVDTGCVFGNKLTALELPSKKCYEVGLQSVNKNHVYHLKGSNRRSERFEVNLPVVLNNFCTKTKLKAVDYSESGMMLYYDKKNGEVKIEIEDQLEGEIGAKDKESFPFVGKVKRVQNQKHSAFYGIEFTKSPFELTQKSEIHAL